MNQFASHRRWSTKEDTAIRRALVRGSFGEHIRRTPERAALIRRNTRGSCTAPRPTMTPSQPVSEMSRRALAADVTSPLPICAAQEVRILR